MLGSVRSLLGNGVKLVTPGRVLYIANDNGLWMSSDDTTDLYGEIRHLMLLMLREEVNDMQLSRNL
jgi:hypothetical protein